MKANTTAIKVLRDGYGAWISDPAKAVKKAVEENIKGVFINNDGSAIVSAQSKKASSKDKPTE